MSFLYDVNIYYNNHYYPDIIDEIYDILTLNNFSLQDLDDDKTILISLDDLEIIETVRNLEAITEIEIIDNKPIKIFQGKNKSNFTNKQFEDIKNNYQKVIIDLGCGKGDFGYDLAKSNNQDYIIAVDPTDNMADTYKKSNKSLKKGGVNNLTFINSNAQQLPKWLKADHLHINYPWGSLLQGMTNNSENIISKISKLLKINSELELILNYSVLSDKEYCQRLNVEILPGNFKELKDYFKKLYKKSNLELEEIKFLNNDDVINSRWAKKLVKSGNKESLYLKFRKRA